MFYDLRDLFTDPEGNTVTLTAMVVQDNGIRAGWIQSTLLFSEVLDPATGIYHQRNHRLGFRHRQIHDRDHGE